MPPLPAVKPKAQLKGLQWTKLPNLKVGQTIWIERHIAEGTQSVKLDLEALEDAFAAKKPGEPCWDGFFVTFVWRKGQIVLI